jgi:hypothetical protein
VVIILCDPDDHVQVKKRIHITSNIIKAKVADTIEIKTGAATGWPNCILLYTLVIMPVFIWLWNMGLIPRPSK